MAKADFKIIFTDFLKILFANKSLSF